MVFYTDEHGNVHMESGTVRDIQPKLMVTDKATDILTEATQWYEKLSETDQRAYRKRLGGEKKSVWVMDLDLVLDAFKKANKIIKS